MELGPVIRGLHVSGDAHEIGVCDPMIRYIPGSMEMILLLYNTLSFLQEQSHLVYRSISKYRIQRSINTVSMRLHVVLYRMLSSRIVLGIRELGNRGLQTELHTGYVESDIVFDGVPVDASA